MERRDKALVILRFVSETIPRHEGTALKMLGSPEVSMALVECLCNLLPEARRAETEGSYHSQAERNAVWLLTSLSDNGV